MDYMRSVFVLFYSFCLIKDSKRLPSRNSTDKTKTVSWHHLPNWIWLSSESTEIEPQLFQVKHVYLRIQRKVPDQKRQIQIPFWEKSTWKDIRCTHISFSCQVQGWDHLQRRLWSFSTGMKSECLSSFLAAALKIWRLFATACYNLSPLTANVSQALQIYLQVR